MSTLSVLNPTLADMAKLRDPDGNIALLVELLNQQNEIIEDLTMKEGNQTMGNTTTVRVGLPSATWRKLYGYTTATKGKVAQVTDNCGMLTALSSIDAKLADLNDNEPAWRMSEDAAHIEAMNQEFAGTLIYGSESTEPEAFTGLAARYNSLSAESGDNVVDFAGSDTGDITSMYLVVWSPATAFCFSPKGGASGLTMKDKGRVTVFDGSGGQRDDVQTEYSWDVGFCLRDWRFAGRLANIDVSDLATIANAETLIGKMIDLEERIPNLGAGRAVWYCSRTLRTYLRKAILEKVSNQLTFETVAGKRVVMFDGIPVRRVDQISHSESVIS
jgi:hypothetical protein